MNQLNLLYTTVLILLIADCVKAQGQEAPSVLEDSLRQLAARTRMVQALQRESALMPESVQSPAIQLVQDVLEGYAQLSDHQKNLLHKEEYFSGKVLSKRQNFERFKLIHDKLQAQIQYLRKEKGHASGIGIIVNAATQAKGGQRIYLVDLQNGIIIEDVCSTAWRGIGYTNDSDKTPLGYFLVSDKQTLAYENRTIMGKVTDMFRKLQHQQWLEPAKWLHRVNTQTEKAYITSNQLALKGKSDGTEALPLAAVGDLYHGDSAKAYINNLNTASRHIYIHGTNRLEQLGNALSGGCVRVSNSMSFLLAYVFKQQGDIPVFIDYVKFKDGQDVPPSDLDEILSDLETAEMVAESYNGLMQTNFVGTPIRAKIDERIVNQIVGKLRSSPGEAQVTIHIEASIPFPESAMRDWIYFRDSLGQFHDHLYRYTYDQKSNHFATAQAHDPSLDRPITLAEADKILDTRIETVQQYILQQLEAKCQAAELNFKYIKKNIVFEYAKPMAINAKGESEAFAFAISKGQQSVLGYYTFLDSLAKANPQAFQDREELRWIAGFLAKKQQIFERNLGGKNFLDVVTYEDALLAQAYLYALGEQDLRQLAYVEGKIGDVNNDEEFFERYNIRQVETLKKLDFHGNKLLYRHSRSDQSRLPSKFLVGELKQSNQRILGIIQVSEEYFSKFKAETNQIVVRQSVDQTENIIFASAVK